MVNNIGIPRIEDNVIMVLAIPIMTTIAKIGAKFPDIDHEWEFVKDKTVINKVINTVIYMTDDTHRSWRI